jgi:hypothetical protein
MSRLPLPYEALDERSFPPIGGIEKVRLAVVRAAKAPPAPADVRKG